jgi:RNA polymerase sigma factor (sigma-70 family)
MPEPYHLSGIDELGGQAVFLREDQWFHVSIDDAWHPRKLQDSAEATRLTFLSPFRGEEREFASQGELVQFVRESWRSRYDLLAIDAQSVAHLLPEKVRARLPKPSRDLRPEPHALAERPLLERVWEYALEHSRGHLDPWLGQYLDAEDLATAAWIRLARNREILEQAAREGEGSLRGYVTGAIRIVAKDSARQFLWQYPPPPPPPPAPWLWPGRSPPGWAEPPYTLSIERGEVAEEEFAVTPVDPLEVREEQGELEEAVREALNGLSDRERLVISARYFQERPYSEISIELGMTVGLVRRIMHRAMERLRDILRGRGLE